MYINKNKTEAKECSQTKTGEIKSIWLGDKQLSKADQFGVLERKITWGYRSNKDIKDQQKGSY